MSLFTASLLLLQLQIVGPQTPFERSSALLDEDCNANGIADSYDISSGSSPDCQGDGIPDECQLAAAFRYVWAGELLPGVFGGIGANEPNVGWLIQFTVDPGHEVITEVDVAWGAAPPGTPATLAIWSDPNQDGDPTDAQVLTSMPVTSSLEFSGAYVTYDVPDTTIGPAGTSFFIGLYGPFAPAPTTFPAGMDFAGLDQTSWWITSNTPIQPNNLMGGGVVEWGLIGDNCGCDGDWAIRGVSCTTGHCEESADTNENQVPDECDPDCNENGIPDDLDIQNGTETDCDANGVPDSCQGLADCDANGLVDLCQAATPQGLSAEYYPNVDLAGSPISRIDPNVNFDFGVTPPLPAPFPITDFSARWTGSVTTLGAGTYTFGVRHDDGTRLWVNGVLLIDEWHPSSGDLDTATIDLAGGTEYFLKLEYYQGNGDALVELLWDGGGELTAMIPSELSPIYDRNTDGIPDGCQIADCNGNGVADVDDIAFGTSTDCDGNLTPDECERCDDCDGNGLLDSCELVLGPGLAGQYFRLSSSPDPRVYLESILTRVDATIDFNWGRGSPDPLVPDDDFGIRWTGTLTTPAVAGSYTFHLETDDGVRLWIDDELLIDEWHPASTTFTAGTNLAASTSYLLVLEYYEAGGSAKCNLRWTVPGGSEVTIPSSALRPDTDLDLDTIPDLCIEDCNLNGVPDPLELDADGNCVPDDCDGGTGYWRFEEAGGPTALDSLGNGLDGNLSSSPAPVRVTDVPVSVVPGTGAANVTALDLEGTETVTVPDTGGQLTNPGTSFTLEGWVKLLFPSSNSSVNQRRWLFMKKDVATPDTQLEYAFLVQAGDLGPTGRELAFRYGDGASVQGITSALTIDDTDWHFVSVAYDAPRRELRFGLDGTFESVVLDLPELSGAGPLTIGAHQNAAGTYNQWVFAIVDELRFTRAFLSEGDLLDAP